MSTLPRQAVADGDQAQALHGRRADRHGALEPSARAGVRPAGGWRPGNDREVADNDVLLMLDIETVPDPDLVPADWPADRFPKCPWHRIVAISVAEAAVERDVATGVETYAFRSCRSGGEPGWDEERLLRAFWRLFEARRYRLVTWNGRSFDMPVILARSLMYGLSAAPWFVRGTRWASYGQRYAQDWHLDLMDAMSSYGASPRLTLDEAAAAAGAPGKMGQHGSCVAEMVARGELGRVRDYCETDVANLYIVYLRWAHLTGRTDAVGHDEAVEGLLRYLDAEGVTRTHLGAFADEWGRGDGRVPLRVGRRPDPATAGDVDAVGRASPDGT